MKSWKVSSSDGEVVCNELSVLVSIVGVVRTVVLSVISDPINYANEEDIGVWTEVDGEMIHILDTESDTATCGRHPALDGICGCDKFNLKNGSSTVSSNSNRKVEECRYLTLLVFTLLQVH